MQTTRKPDEKSKTKEKKDDIEEKKKITSTPRNYVQKSSTTDIYGKKKTQVKAPKKTQGLTKNITESPMKNLLKSSSSSISQVSSVSERKTGLLDKKRPPDVRVQKSSSNVTINSPAVKRKLNLTNDKEVRERKEISKRDERVINREEVNRDGKARRAVDNRLGKIDGKESNKREDTSQRDLKSNRKVEKGGGDNIDGKRLKKDGKSDGTSRREIGKDAEPDNLRPRKEVGNKKSFDDNIRNRKEVGDGVDTGSSEFENRERTKTRTLGENEVKLLTPDAVDNNVKMFNLSRTLKAKPKAFYVDLDEGTSKKETKEKSDEEVSYEDDFESYESDFDSYQSSEKNTQNEVTSNGDTSEDEREDRNNSQSERDKSTEDIKDRDEENMLDSGNFDLRESQRSANRTKPVLMDFILEDREVDVKASLTDEGFQEMSSSSAVSSMRTVHIDVLDRSLFVDFKKSKQNKRKRQIFERLKQRANDILSMVTLHEMSYSLFEMKPIPYDLFMATYGKSNYIQTAAQTFEDGIAEEVQTEEIECNEKWTQHPVKFSKHDIFLKPDDGNQKYNKNNQDYLSKFTLLLNKNSDDLVNNKIIVDENYKANPLRVYFEQKDGVGNCEMLPYENYNAKLENNDYNVNRLSKFLKKVENRIDHVLNMNTGTQELPDVARNSKFPFSKGYITLSNKNIGENSFLKYAKITNIVFSDSKNNFILTIHNKHTGNEKCIACLWDLNVARREPIKLLTAIDNIAIGRFTGNTEGIFVAVLEDSTIHLWDLSEEPMYHNVASVEKTTNLVDIKNSEPLTEMEKDREWNLKNSNVGYDMGPELPPLQASAYTNSALNMKGGVYDRVVGLEVEWGLRGEQDGIKVIGQVCSLQRVGILTIWSIIQEKLSNTSTDIGKAFWSKMKLEKQQIISLIEHINIPRIDTSTKEDFLSFNLNSAKRRLSMRKKEKSAKVSRPRSVKSDRPSTANIRRRVLPAECNWENGVVCYDLKIMKHGNVNNYLIGKNCGEVLCCVRNSGSVRVNSFSVCNEASSITCIEVSPHNLPYFLAATDVGTVNLCSVLDNRVLLTLDCRNQPQDKTQKYAMDSKGRFVGTTTVKTTDFGIDMSCKMSVASVHWSAINPCCVFIRLLEGDLMVWDFAHSDIYANYSSDKAALACATKDNVFVLLTFDNDVQVHRLGSEEEAKKLLQLFSKYITLL